ncbi:coiled-coil domain-containing protein 158 isoform X3 [Ascaphus truei]|uniref:coiled-coil domain-containing protein 158 isoform X3 n=1 Tax=Ascaphus truei TaxID=8439 RepID=UPI003F5A37D7
MGSKSIKELREALEKETRETKKLQQEVEQATKYALDKLSQSYHERGCEHVSDDHYTPTGVGATSSLVGNHKWMPSPPLHNSMLQSSLTASGHTSPIKSSLMSKYDPVRDSLRGSSTCAEKPPLKEVLEDYDSQFKSAQKKLNESSDLHEQQKFQLRQSITDLQAIIQKLELERDTMLDIGLKESNRQQEANEQLQVTIQELRTAHQLQEETLKQLNVQIEQLKEMVQSHDTVLQDIQGALLSYEEHSGKKVYEQGPVCNLGTAVSKVLQELDSEVSFLKQKLDPVEDHLHDLKKELQDKEILLKQHKERYETLVNEKGQEVAALTDDANSARSQANNIQTRMEIFQEQAKDQSTTYMQQIANLESAVSQLRSELRNAKRGYRDKVEELKEQLVSSNLALTGAQNEHAQSIHELGNLGDQFKQLSASLQKCEKELRLEKEQNKQLWDRDTVHSLTNEHLRREMVERSMEIHLLETMVNSMKEESQQQMERQMVAIHQNTANLQIVSSHLESTKEALHKTVEELAAKNLSLESAERNKGDLKTRLEEKEKTLKTTMDELKKLRFQAEAKKRERQQLKSDGEQLIKVLADVEMMKLHLTEKDHIIIAMRDQVADMTRVVGQHSQRAGAMQVENAQLLGDVGDRKAEIQEIKIIMEKKDARISELEALFRDLEMEKLKLTNAGSEMTHAVKDLRLERDQLVTELKVTRNELASLAEDYDVLKRNCRNMNEERDSTTSMLKMHLKATVAELEQTKNTVKTMEGSDGQAIKVAMGMQKKITAKRGQIDALQSRIQFLEETLSNTTKDKHHLKEETAKLTHELGQEAAERQKLSGELEMLKSEKYKLKENVVSMEAALDKASLQFSECQAVIQHLEQESMRLRLQHTLDLKELKGPTITDIAATANPLSCPYSANHPFPQALLPFITCSAACSKDLIMENPTRDVNQLSKELQTGTFVEKLVLQSNSSETTNRTSGNLHVAVEEVTRDFEVNLRLDSYSREPLTLHTLDLEDSDDTLSITHAEDPFSATPCYTSSPKKSSKDNKLRPRSPVHALLTVPANRYEVTSTLESRPLSKNTNPQDLALGGQSIDITDNSFQKLQSRLETLQSMAEDFQINNTGRQSPEVTGNTGQKLQSRLETLQTMADDLQMKNKEMSSMIRNQEKRILKVKNQEKRLMK